MIDLKSGETAYILGRGGQTKRRLANFSGASINVEPKGSEATLEIAGTPRQIELAKMCVDITLMQRNSGNVNVDFLTLEKREDCEVLPVPAEAVGFVMGSKGATLRDLETRFRTFMFFDNANDSDGKKRMFILGSAESRSRCVREIQKAIDYKMSGASGNFSRRSPPPARRRSRSRSRDRDHRDHRDSRDSYRDSRDSYRERDSRDSYRDSRDSYRDSRDSYRDSRDSYRRPSPERYSRKRDRSP